MRRRWLYDTFDGLEFAAVAVTVLVIDRIDRAARLLRGDYGGLAHITARLDDLEGLGRSHANLTASLDAAEAEITHLQAEAREQKARQETAEKERDRLQRLLDAPPRPIELIEVPQGGYLSSVPPGPRGRR